MSSYYPPSRPDDQPYDPQAAQAAWGQVPATNDAEATHALSADPASTMAFPPGYDPAAPAPQAQSAMSLFPQADAAPTAGGSTQMFPTDPGAGQFGNAAPHPTQAMPAADPYPYGQQPYAQQAYGQPPYAGSPYGGQPYADPYAQGVGGYVPPPKSNAPLVLGIVGALLLAAILGVGGFLVISSSGDGTEKASDSGPSASSSPSAGQSQSPSTGPSAEPSEVDDGSRLAPAGAPYSLKVPSGYREIKPQSEYEGGKPAYETGLGLTSSSTQNYDIIIVSAFTAPYDTDDHSYGELEDEMDELLKGIGQSAGSAERIEVDGKRGLKYVLQYDDAKQWSYFVFSNRYMIQVRCQWLNAETDIKSGCQSVLDSMRVR